jgi:hypothetical protein
VSEDIKKTLKLARRKVINRIRKTFAPHLYEGGYKTGPDRTGSFKNSRPLKIWAPRDKNGHVTTASFDGYALQELYAYTEIGLMVDAYGGGCVTESLSCFPLEDLLMFADWAELQFSQSEQEQKAAA